MKFVRVVENIRCAGALLFGSHMKCSRSTFIVIIPHSIPVSGEEILSLLVVSHSRCYSWWLVVWSTTLHQNNSLLHYVQFYVETWTECVKVWQRSSRFSSYDFNKCSIKVIDGRKYNLQVMIFWNPWFDFFCIRS